MASTRTDKIAAALGAVFLGLLAAESVLFPQTGLDFDPPKRCSACDARNEPGEPLPGFGDTLPPAERTTLVVLANP